MMKLLPSVFAILLAGFQSFLLAQPISPPSGEHADLTTFDLDKTELQWADNRWQLLADGLPLKDFGRREADGRLALRLTRELKLNQHGTLGSPQPIIEYWLSDGRAPVGPCLGLRTTPIDLEHIRVEEVQKQWCVRDAYRILFNFGSQEGEAKNAVALIRRYRFNQIGYVGQGVPTMLVFLADSKSAPEAETDSLKVSRVAKHERMTAPLMAKGQSQKMSDDGAKPEGQQAAASQALTKPDKALESKVPELAHANLAAAMPHARQLAEPSTLSETEGAVEHVPFDWRQVQVKKVDREWKVTSGNLVLGTYGNNEKAADQAVTLIRTYHYTEQCKLGQSHPSFVYYLCNGLPPHGTILGISAIPFHAAELAVKQIGPDWVVADSFRTIAAFGAKSEEAAQALKILKRYQFDRVMTVGSGTTPDMIFFAHGN
jgi:hypothetical protein